MQQVEWTVGGIQCEGCAKSIHSALSRLEGVQEVSIDVAAKHVMVRYDAAKTSVDAIRRQIEDAGYTVGARS
ncbi:MAG TPA: heavy-metal-associated domain-containing protein [Armatimonadota bacterium]|nr:heavy-metal-associated domain-containing protein [Armatimonadota bacterium]